jgi:hypothetical protein
MLTDSVNSKKAAADSGSATGKKAKESLQVLDVAQLLLTAVKTPAGPADDSGTASEPEPEPAQ